MTTLFKRHTVILIYHVVFIALVIGVVKASGTDYLGYLFLFYGVLLTFYLLMERFWPEKNFQFSGSLSPQILRILSVGLGVICVTVPLLHAVHLGYVPVLKALNSLDYIEVANIRRSISQDTAKWMAYLSSFSVKALIPFALLYFYIVKRRWLFYLILFTGAFYAVFLMQKSFILTMLMPLGIYSLFARKWLITAVCTCLVVGGIFFLLYTANTHLRGGEYPDELRTEKNELNKDEINRSFTYALANRVFFVPGKIVADWFTHVPRDLNYQNGCGYRFMTPILDCEFRNYARELYDLIYPENARNGLQGNVNTASFMYDYANFGWKGLVMAGLLLATLFQLIEQLYRKHFLLKISMNTFFILMLSSSALSTLLFSGGWMLMLGSFFIFNAELTKYLK